MQPVKIYTTNYCGYCVRAKDFLSRKGVPFQEIDVTGNDEMRSKLVELSGGMKTVPQIFIGETHVGGYTDMMKLETEGRLQGLLNS
jgi:glutaredoxin 3